MLILKASEELGCITVHALPCRGRILRGICLKRAAHVLAPLRWKQRWPTQVQRLRRPARAGRVGPFELGDANGRQAGNRLSHRNRDWWTIRIADLESVGRAWLHYRARTTMPRTHFAGNLSQESRARLGAAPMEATLADSGPALATPKSPKPRLVVFSIARSGDGGRVTQSTCS